MKNISAYIWGVGSRFAPQLLYMLTTMVLARFLTPDDFGTIGVLSIIFMVANTLIDSGLGGSLVKEKNITDLDCSTISTFNICISSTIYFIIFIFSPYIESYYEIENLTLITRLVSLEFVISSLGLVPKSLLIRQLRFKDITIASIGIVFIASVVAIIAAIYGAGVYSLVIYRLVYAVSRVVFQFSLTHYRLSFRFSRISFKKLISFGIFTTIASVIDTIYENLLTTLTGKYMNVKEAGYMYQAKQLETAVAAAISNTIGSVSFPILAKIKDDVDAFKREADSIFKTIVIGAFPLMVVISVFSKPIIIVLYGHQWEDSAFYLSWLMIAGMIHVLENLNRVFIKSHADVAKLAGITFIKRAIGILIILFSLKVSAKAIVFGYVISALIAYLMNQLLYCRIVSIGYFGSLVGVFKLLLPSILLMLLLLVFNRFVSSLWLQLLWGALMVGIYYVFFAPLYGINVYKIVKQYIKR
jgi:O-antigen/teichoic acid export membrane protein